MNKRIAGFYLPKHSIEYWRNVAMANIYLAGANAMSKNTIAATQSLSDEAILRCTEYQEWNAIVDRFEKHETMLPSMDAAIDELCAEHGISSVAIRMMAGTQIYTPMHPDMKPDADIVADLRGCWAKMLDGRKNEH